MPPSDASAQNPAWTTLRILRRRLPIILAAVVVTAAAVTAYSLTQPKKYTASSVLLFRTPGFDTAILGTPFFQPDTDPARTAATNLKLVSLNPVSTQTARAIGHGVTGSQVASEVSVSEIGQSDLASIDVT